jgi:hypothetical protein
MMGLVQ